MWNARSEPDRVAEPDLHALLTRLEQLESEREIVRTINQFGHTIDYGLEAEWLDCFLPDGELDVIYGDRPPSRMALGTRHARGVLHRGTEQLAAWIAGHTRPPVRIHKHLYIEPRIKLEGETATSITYMTRVDVIGGQPEVYAFGRYHDEWSRCDDGRWRIKRRRIEIEGQRDDAPPPYAPNA
ncbi:MAG TPA: nuclear transport factor 2 family protein [Candidatus Dormibacteraeota bacterium]